MYMPFMFPCRRRRRRRDDKEMESRSSSNKAYICARCVVSSTCGCRAIRTSPSYNTHPFRLPSIANMMLVGKVGHNNNRKKRRDDRHGGRILSSATETGTRDRDISDTLHTSVMRSYSAIQYISESMAAPRSTSHGTAAGRLGLKILFAKRTTTSVEMRESE